MSVKVMVNWEYSAEEFWNEFNRLAYAMTEEDELRGVIISLAHYGEVELYNSDIIQAFDKFVHNIPGFTDSSEEGKEAIIFQQLN